jgi:hypothetical protein
MASACSGAPQRRRRRGGTLEIGLKTAFSARFGVDTRPSNRQKSQAFAGGAALSLRPGERFLPNQVTPMAKKNNKKTGTTGDLIISKSRTKAAVKKSNVSSDFYGALDATVRKMITAAEVRAEANGRKTLRPQDL